MNRTVLFVVMASIGLLIVLDGGWRAASAAETSGHDPVTPASTPPATVPPKSDAGDVPKRKRGRPKKQAVETPAPKETQE